MTAGPVTLAEYVALRGLSAGDARLLAAWPVVVTAAHELGHALTLRADGWRIVFLTTIPGPGYGGMAVTGGATPEGLEEPGTAAASKWSSSHAAHAAESRIEAEMLNEWLELAAVGPDATAEALARLAPDDREHATAALAGDPVPDRAKEAALAAPYGDAGPAVSAVWQARAMRDVDAFWPALLRLLPALLRARVWTGEDLEDAIADAPRPQSPAP